MATDDPVDRREEELLAIVPRERRKLYRQFKEGEVQRLIVSKVGNFAIDLPDASVMVQISGTFGSRQEEAQRLGRILRPKQDGLLAHFYTLVSKDTKDQDFGAIPVLLLDLAQHIERVISAAVVDEDRLNLEIESIDRRHQLAKEFGQRRLLVEDRQHHRKLHG